MILRGVALRIGTPKCPANSLYSQARTFTSFSARLAKPRPRQTLSKPARPPPKPSNTPKAPSDYRFLGKTSDGLVGLEKKTIRLGQLLLFDAPSQRSYVLGAYSVSAFCFAYAVINSSFNLKPDTSTWLKGAYFSVCIVMSAMGTIFISRTGRLIRKITAVSSADGVKLLVDVRSSIPFRKPYTITTTPRQMLFSRNLPVNMHRVTPDGKLRRPAAPVSFFKQPVAATSYTLFRIFRSFQRIFTQEDFVMVEIDGQKGAYRMDSNGFLADDIFAIGTRAKARR